MDISVSQFLMVLLFIGVLLILSPCNSLNFGSLDPFQNGVFHLTGGRPLKGGLGKGSSCSSETTPCKRGLTCLEGTCRDTKTKDDDMFN